MTLEENIKAILECNFSIAREEVVESATKRIMEQISRQNPLEDIKVDIEFITKENGMSRVHIDDIRQILDKHIKENKQ